MTTQPPPAPPVVPDEQPYALAQLMLAPPKTRRRWPWIACGAVLLVALSVAGTVAILNPGGTRTPAAAPTGTAGTAATASPASMGGSCPQLGSFATTADGAAVVCQAVSGSPIWVDPATVVESPGSTYAEPVPANFKLTVKITKKQCFGSAGCNVEYHIVVSYHGTADPSKTYLVTYQVKGDESGPIINTFKLTGEQVEYESEESASTKSNSTKLTAKVTDVAEE